MEPAVYICRSDSFETLEMHIQQGRIDPNGKYGHREKSLVKYCVINNSFRCLEVLIRYGANIKNLEDGIVSSLFECLKLLLKAGVNPNIQDEEGTTSLHYSSSLCNEESISMLIEYKADVNIKDKDGNTPLHCLVIGEIYYENNDEYLYEDENENEYQNEDEDKNEYENKDEEDNFLKSFRLLIENGSNLYEKNNEGICIIDVLSGTQLKKETCKKCLEIIEQNFDIKEPAE